MVPTVNNSIRFVIGLLCVLVISLGGTAYAVAPSPVVANLEPITGVLRTPLRMALDSDGSIFVADPRSGGVVQLDRYGALVQVIKTAKPAEAVALLDSIKSNIPNGKILVGQGNYVAVLSQSCAVVGETCTEVARIGETGAGKLVKAAGIAVDPDGNIFVTDSGARNVKKFNNSGGHVSTFGAGSLQMVCDADDNCSYMLPPGSLVFPGAIAAVNTTAGIQIVVVDMVDRNIKFYSASGVYIKTLGSTVVVTTLTDQQVRNCANNPAGYAYCSQAAPLSFNYPVGISFEYYKSGTNSGTIYRMYVLDAFQGNVQVIDPVLNQPIILSNANNYIGSYGKNSGNLITPYDILVDQTPISGNANTRLLVANGLSNIAIFSIDGGRNPEDPRKGVPPNLTIDTFTALVDQPSLDITGAIDPDCKLTASVDTTANVNAAIDVASPLKWTAKITDLMQGANVVTLTAKNYFGAVTTKTATITYRPATVAFSINKPASPTTNPSVTLSGTVAPGSTVNIANTTSGISGFADISGGTWSYNLMLTAEGTNNISLLASQKGASSAASNIQIVLDTQPPVLTVSALPDNSSTANQVQNISGTVKDLSLTGVTVNSVPATVSNGNFSYAFTLVKGENIITVDAVDSLNHHSTNTRKINFVPSAPVITVLTPDNASYTNVETVSVSGTVDKSASVTVNGVAANPGGGLNWSASVKLASGVNSINIRATDQFGVEGSAFRTITYDSRVPEITISIPSSDIAIKDTGLSFSGMVSDFDGIKSVTATMNRTVPVPVTLVTVDEGTKTFSLYAEASKNPDGSYKQGSYTIEVTATDRAGNTSSVQRSFVYDSTPPLLTIDKVTVPYPLTLTGTVERAATIEVKDTVAGCIYNTRVTDVKWTADLQSGCMYDKSSLRVTARDAAGNLTSLLGIDTPVPDGDMDGDGKVTVADALEVIRLVVSNQTPTDAQLAHGDVGPFLNGKKNSSGKLEIEDGIHILRKALGLDSWQ